METLMGSPVESAMPGTRIVAGLAFKVRSGRRGIDFFGKRHVVTAEDVI
jgi:hypothetical protein